MKRLQMGKLMSLFLIIAAFCSCKKNEYIKGGQIENNIYKNTTTYDALKQDPAYDTLIQVIDAAGAKDKINAPGTTFFAPSDYSIYNYLSQRTNLLQVTVNQNAQFGLDSLLYYMANNVHGTRDSLLLYIVPQTLHYSDLIESGKKYLTSLPGDTVIVSYEETKDVTLGYNSVTSSFPRLVYFTQLWYPYNVSDNNPVGNIPTNIGVRTRVITSGIQTQNGIINELGSSHTLFFYGTKQ